MVYSYSLVIKYTYIMLRQKGYLRKYLVDLLHVVHIDGKVKW